MKHSLRTWTRAAAIGAALISLAACGGDAGGTKAGAAPGGDTAAAASAAKGADTATTPQRPATKYAFGNSAAEAAQCQQRLQTQLDQAAAGTNTANANTRAGAGTNPAFAKQEGWFPKMPEFRDGSILPCNRIVVYYGNPNSKRMGALGEFPKDEMLSRLRRQVDAYKQIDPNTPVVPGLHMVAVVAQGDPGTSGHYRAIASDADVNKVYGWAKEVNGIFFVDIQVGTDNIRNLLPRFDWILKNPDVHLAVDPEFMMLGGARPGTKIGTMTAADINYVTDHAAKIVRENNLPPKVVIIHRFTQRMVLNYQDIQLRPEVQLVIHMDGWGRPWLKRDSYRDYMVKEPVQYPGIKIFYGNDTKAGSQLMTPTDVMALWPKPLYIQYQ